MQNYKFSLRAEGDIDRIFSYGAENYGITRARRYIIEIYAEINSAAQSPKMWPQVQVDDKKLRRFVFKGLSIFYTEESDHIKIIRILGRQNPSGQFQEPKQEPYHGQT